jgi:hypothetical protein
VSATSTVSVIRFDQDCAYLSARGKRAYKNTRVEVTQLGASTDPQDALTEAAFIFATTQHHKGLLIIITDGLWSETGMWGHEISSEVSDGTIQRLNEAGITTALVFLDSITAQRMRRDHNLTMEDMRHNAQVFTTVTEPMHIVKFAKDVVAKVMHGRATR